MSETVKRYLLLHAVLLVYSLASVCSKLASGAEFMSLRFILLYGGVLLLLAVYAVAWQQVIKRMPLSVAYANKAVTVLWGLLWGLLLFGEALTAGKLAGALMIAGGIVLYALPEKEAD